ncbi:MAG: tyrosine-type recombinase/integrase, partial [Candidatus Wallbacteria bacterium]|nr:tyrosine-type recombinase/integrase [Candidatus Wallbacteria bacterium]
MHTLEEYLTRRGAEGLSPATVRHRRYTLARLVVWMQRRRLCWSDLTPTRISAYIQTVRERRVRVGPHRTRAVSPTTVFDVVDCLRVFFRWLVDEGVILVNPMTGFHAARPRVICGLGLFSRGQIARILAQLRGDHPYSKRERAIVAVLYGGGLRVGEAVRLTIADYDAQAGLLWVRRAKGNKDRVVPLGRRARRDLDRYLAEARPLLDAKQGEPALFLNARGMPMTVNRVWYRLRTVQKAAGLAHPLGCHA